MLLTPHTFVGVAIASSISNPLIAFPISVASHFLGDLIPHWDFYSETSEEERISGWRVFAVMGDLALGVAFGVFCATTALWKLENSALALNILLCGIGSVLPDIITGATVFLNSKNKLLRIVCKVQSVLQWQAPLVWGMLSQLIVLGSASLVILRSVQL